MTGGWTTISASTIAIASAAAAARATVRKTKLQDCHLLGIRFTSSPCGSNEIDQRDGRTRTPGRRKLDGLVSRGLDRSGWKKGRGVFPRDTHQNFTPAAVICQ